MENTLGRLERVNLRKVWASESEHFTPWLAQGINLKLLGDAVGVESACRHFWDLGLMRRWVDPRKYGLRLAVGALPVRLEDLVRAYGVLANEGRSFNLRWFARPKGGTRGVQVIPEDVARQLTLFLSDPMARLPSFPRQGWLEYPMPVAVKTGTPKGYRDAWCVAYSQKYIVGVWVGHPENYPMKRRCGADSAALVVHRIMEFLHPEAMQGLEDLSFPPPHGYVAKRICMLTGKLARTDTPYGALEWFKPGTEPVDATDAYREMDIDAKTGQLAGPDTPTNLVQKKTFVVLDSRFASWAKASGLELPPIAGPELFEKMLSDRDPKLKVQEPADGSRILPDPEVPADCATIPLQASVEPPVPQAVWYVDGQYYELVDYPYTTRWPIVPGNHTFQLRLPFAPVTSSPVHVTVVQ